MIIPFKIPLALEEKCRRLHDILQSHECVAVAYSGGADSTFLAWFVKKVLAREAVAVLVNSPFISRSEHEGAHRTAAEVGFDLEEISINPASLDIIRANPPERCYYCKREVMTHVRRRAEELNCTIIVDGSHAGDALGHRPGRRALQELNIVSPLALAGFLKPEIRELSRLAHLPTWNKPSQSCLATRIDYGTELSEERLSMIEKAESVLLELGCDQVRVRVHGNLARIEVSPRDFPLLIESSAREHICRRFRELGFVHVSLDLAGYRSGSWDMESTPQSGDQ